MQLTVSLTCSFCSVIQNLDLRPFLRNYCTTKKGFWGMGFQFFFYEKQWNAMTNRQLWVRRLIKRPFDWQMIWLFECLFWEYKGTVHACLFDVRFVCKHVLYGMSFFWRTLYNFCNIVHLILYITVLKTCFQMPCLSPAVKISINLPCLG